MPRLPPLLSLCVAAAPALADSPVIEHITAERGDIGWSISVTLSHPDTGWDHYADGWEVLDAQGNRIGLRTLHHPHVSEQPFTRSLTGVMVPDGAHRISVRARCSVDGWAGDSVAVALER
jgi:hypothetical protein